MFDWISQNNQVISTIVNLVMTLVWVVYLQIFLLTIRYARKPMIMISRGVGTGKEARLFISNMGAEPIYITAVIADCETAHGPVSATITEKDDISADSLASWKEATNEGPLGSGAYMDAGSFESLVSRIGTRLGCQIALDQIERLTLTVIAATGHSASLSAGRKTYTVFGEGEDVLFHPVAASTDQLRNLFARRRIHQRLEAQLRAEAEAARNAEGRSPSREREMAG